MEDKQKMLVSSIFPTMFLLFQKQVNFSDISFVHCKSFQSGQV